jgi:two-component system nitrogen regulation sensor histidine kinase NtrY
MNRLRTRLIAVFVLATLLPLGLTLWTTVLLLERSFEIAPLQELESVTDALQQTGVELYQQAAELLRDEIAGGRAKGRDASPEEARAFLERGVDEQCGLAGERREMVECTVRRGDRVVVYTRAMPLPMDTLTAQIARAREALETPATRDLRGGFNKTLLVVSAALWVAALAAMIILASHITRPVRRLTEGLERVASGDLKARVPAGGSGEIGAAVAAFNQMAEQLEQAREHLIQMTRLASWQALARKMAHEVKNSLTPIRLTMEEIVSRKGKADSAFLEQAAQIVADEVNTLERRVRAFSEFASEPPVTPREIDVNALVEERIALLKAAHPGVVYEVSLAPDRPRAVADPDLVKGMLTNLLENAAQAVPPGGVVRARTACDGAHLRIEVLDSGPGLSPAARESLFEPTISFKKGGMGLGLSIAHRSALLCGGEIQTFDGELGGAGFRLLLPAKN